MTFIIAFLLLIVPGFIGAAILRLISPATPSRIIVIGLIIDLLVFIINITGLYFIKDIFTVTELEVYFDCLSFIRKYALLSILISIILGIIGGIILRFLPYNTRTLNSTLSE